MTKTILLSFIVPGRESSICRRQATNGFSLIKGE